MVKVTLYARQSGSRKPLKVKNINKVYAYGTFFGIDAANRLPCLQLLPDL